MQRWEGCWNGGSNSQRKWEGVDEVRRRRRREWESAEWIPIDSSWEGWEGLVSGWIDTSLVYPGQSILTVFPDCALRAVQVALVCAWREGRGGLGIVRRCVSSHRRRRREGRWLDVVDGSARGVGGARQHKKRRAL